MTTTAAICAIVKENGECVAEIAIHDRNDTYDPAALRYVPDVRRMLARLGPR